MKYSRYGLAIFDDCVGLGGYNEDTGFVAVFVDSGSAIVMGWAEQVFESYREHSERVDVTSSATVEGK